MSQYTPQEIEWYQQALASGQYTEQTAIAAIMQARNPAPVAQTPVAQAVQTAAPAAAAPADLGLFNELAELAAEDEDHTLVGSGKSVPAAGPCHIRFLNFIEIGLHESKNKAHKPSQIAIITVELHSPAHMYEKDGVKVPQTLDIRIPKSQGQNSRWPKFIKAIQRALQPTLGYEITHMAQAIGHACLGTIYHNTNDKGDIFANLDVDKTWSFQPSRFVNPATGATEEVNIPPLHGTPAVFMMNNQKLLADPAKMKFMWDSIFVDGFYEKEKPDGTKEQISRNYYQKLIARSIGWEQSPVKKILDSQGCTTTFGESAPTASAGALPTALAAQVQQVPNVQTPAVQTPATPAPAVQTPVVTPAQPAPAAPAPVSQMPAPTAMVEQAATPVVGQPTAQPAATPAPAAMPAPVATPAAQQAAATAQPAPMDAASFMAAFQQ